MMPTHFLTIPLVKKVEADLELDLSSSTMSFKIHPKNIIMVILLEVPKDVHQDIRRALEGCSKTQQAELGK
jgi:hypothetical protein